MLKKLLCFLWFNHNQSVEYYEDGKGREFRRVHKCHCGKKVTKGEWIDDNHLLGHGTGL
jgi:hypothetical protein